MAIETRSVSYRAGGRSFEGFLADGSGGKRVPGVLVVHEGRGYTQHPKDRAAMLAELGYVAYAPDYMGGAATSLEHAFEMMRRFAEDRTHFHAHGTAALDVLRACPNVDAERLGAIGFCWGGYAVFELACVEKLRCAVGFHPGLSLGPLTDPAAITASLLICAGEHDPYVPMADIGSFLEQMNAHSIDCQALILTGAPHSFTNPEPYVYETGEAHMGYDATADRRSWRAMLNLFDESFG